VLHEPEDRVGDDVVVEVIRLGFVCDETETILSATASPSASSTTAWSSTLIALATHVTSW